MAPFIALTEIKAFLDREPSFQKVVCVCFGDEAARIYRKEAEELR